MAQSAPRITLPLIPAQASQKWIDYGQLNRLSLDLELILNQAFSDVSNLIFQNPNALTSDEKQEIKEITDGGGALLVPKFTAIVGKSWNGTDHQGHFTTINAAIDYLRTTYAGQLNSSQHGTILIYPGTYVEQLDLQTPDERRFIDFFGWDAKTTVLSYNSGFVYATNQADCENQFSNLTIQFTGASASDKAIAVTTTVANVTFENVRIISTQALVHEITSGMKIKNSYLETTSVGTGAMIQNFNGRLENCTIRAASLGAGGRLFNAMGNIDTNSIVFNCDIFVNQAVETNFNFGICNSTVSFCRVFFGGAIRALGDASGAGNLEFSYFNSTCLGSDAMITDVKGNIRNCTFVNASASRMSVGAMSAATGTITESSFYQLSNALDVIAGVVTGNKFRNVNLYNNGSGGFAIAASATSQTITSQQVYSNRPIDTQFSAVDESFDVAYVPTIGNLLVPDGNRWNSKPLGGAGTIDANGILTVTSAPGADDLSALMLMGG